MTFLLVTWLFSLPMQPYKGSKIIKKSTDAATGDTERHRWTLQAHL